MLIELAFFNHHLEMTEVSPRFPYVRFATTLAYIAVQAPFFIAVLFYSSFLPPHWPVVKRTRQVFATLSAALWIPFLGIQVSTQLSSLLTSSPRRTKYNQRTITLFLSTHQSFSDAVILALVFWMFGSSLGPGVALYKRELGKLPVIGPIQRFCGNVAVGRSGDVEDAKRSMSIAAQRGREGYHISGFPEGSRRRIPSTGRTQVSPLKKGFFHLVSDLCLEGYTVEIFPVVFVGSYRSWPVGRIMPVTGSKVTVRVGDPIVVTEKCEVSSLLDMVQTRMGDEIDAACGGGEYDADSAFAIGNRVNLAEVYGFELVLSTLPVLCAVAAAGLSL